MPASILPEAISDSPISSLTSSRKWLLQVSLLFGLLLLGRWGRLVPLRPAMAGLPAVTAPARRSPAPVPPEVAVPEALPIMARYYPAVAGAALASTGL